MVSFNRLCMKSLSPIRNTAAVFGFLQPYSGHKLGRCVDYNLQTSMMRNSSRQKTSMAMTSQQANLSMQSKDVQFASSTPDDDINIWIGNATQESDFRQIIQLYGQSLNSKQLRQLIFGLVSQKQGQDLVETACALSLSQIHNFDPSELSKLMFSIRLIQAGKQPLPDNLLRDILAACCDQVLKPGFLSDSNIDIIAKLLSNFAMVGYYDKLLLSYVSEYILTHKLLDDASAFTIIQLIGAYQQASYLDIMPILIPKLDEIDFDSISPHFLVNYLKDAVSQQQRVAPMPILSAAVRSLTNRPTELDFIAMSQISLATSSLNRAGFWVSHKNEMHDFFTVCVQSALRRDNTDSSLLAMLLDQMLQSQYGDTIQQVATAKNILQELCTNFYRSDNTYLLDATILRIALEGSVRYGLSNTVNEFVSQALLDPNTKVFTQGNGKSIASLLEMIALHHPNAQHLCPLIIDDLLMHDGAKINQVRRSAWGSTLQALQSVHGLNCNYTHRLQQQIELNTKQWQESLRNNIIAGVKDLKNQLGDVRVDIKDQKENMESFEKSVDTTTAVAGIVIFVLAGVCFLFMIFTLAGLTCHIRCIMVLSTIFMPIVIIVSFLGAAIAMFMWTGVNDLQLEMGNYLLDPKNSTLNEYVPCKADSYTDKLNEYKEQANDQIGEANIKFEDFFGKIEDLQEVGLVDDDVAAPGGLCEPFTDDLKPADCPDEDGKNTVALKDFEKEYGVFKCDIDSFDLEELTESLTKSRGAEDGSRESDIVNDCVKRDLTAIHIIQRYRAEVVSAHSIGP